MSRWKKTQFEGVYEDAGSKNKSFRFTVQWRGNSVTRSGFTSAAQARDAREAKRTHLRETDGKITPRRLPVATFPKMVEELVKTNDVRKTFTKETPTKQSRPLYSLLYSSGRDEYLFGVCFKFLAAKNRKHFTDVSLKDFSDWMKENGLSGRTRDMCLRLLRTVYGVAGSRGLYDSNPVLVAKANQVLWTQIMSWTTPKAHPAMRISLPDDDKIKICEVVKQWDDPRAVWVGVNVWEGLRPDKFNAFDLEDFVPRFLFVRSELHKSALHRDAGQPTPTALHPGAIDMLKWYAPRRHEGARFDDVSGFVDAVGTPLNGPFFRRRIGRDGKPRLFGRNNMRRQWALILDRAGVKYASPYAARINSINEMLTAGIPIVDVATHHGNTPETIYREYAKASTVESIGSIPQRMANWKVLQKRQWKVS